MNNVIRFQNTYYLEPPTMQRFAAKRSTKPYKWQRKEMNNVLIKLLKAKDWETNKKCVKLEEYKEPQSFYNESSSQTLKSPYSFGTWSTTTEGTWTTSNYYDY